MGSANQAPVGGVSAIWSEHFDFCGKYAGSKGPGCFEMCLYTQQPESSLMTPAWQLYTLDDMSVCIFPAGCVNVLCSAYALHVVGQTQVLR